jgi:predicted phage terminase large subunit-like protein
MTFSLQLEDDLIVSEEELIASITKESFFEFVCEFWSTVEPRELQVNWHLPYICNELEILARRARRNEPKLHDLIINVCPGTTKSLLCSVLFPAWLWTWWPQCKVITACFEKGLALKLSRKSRRVIKSDKYRLCFPKVKMVDDADALGFFANTKGGERDSVGVGGNITGSHADIILCDDLINPRGARSEKEIENSNLFVTETLWSRKTEKSVTPAIYIQQRLAENDTTGMLLKMQEESKSRDEPIVFKHICFPAILTDNVKPEECRKFYVDGLFDPKRITRKTLGEVKHDEYIYKGQYLQEPVPLGTQLFHVEKIHIETDAPTRWKSRVRFWDKAGTKDGGAYSVGLEMGEDEQKRIWILDIVRGQWDSAVREERMKQTAILDGVEVEIGIEQEPGSGGKESAENTVKNLRGWRVFTERPTGDKAQRAEPFSSQVNGGNVYMVKAVWNKAYLDELQFFSILNSKYKDQVDASSGAFKRLTTKRIRVGAWRP